MGRRATYNVLSILVLVIKNPPANAGDARDVGSVPGLVISLGVGNGNPLPYSCLKYSMERGAWHAIYSSWGPAESQTWLSTHTQIFFLKSLLSLLQYCFCCFMFWGFFFLAVRNVGSWFPDQGPNWQPLPWKMKSQPLDHHTYPVLDVLNQRGLQGTGGRGRWRRGDNGMKIKCEGRIGGSILGRI